MVGGGAPLLGKARQGKVSQPVPAHALRGVGMRRRVRVESGLHHGRGERPTMGEGATFRLQMRRARGVGVCVPGILILKFIINIVGSFSRTTRPYHGSGAASVRG
jgi:hypothetical protein